MSGQKVVYFRQLAFWVVTFAVYAHIVSNINFEYTKEKIVLLLIFSLYR